MVSLAIDQNAVARTLGIEVTYESGKGSVSAILPQRIALIGQGASSAVYDATKKTVTSAYEVGSTYGFGCPLHLAMLMLMPVNGDGVANIPVDVFPLKDPESGGIAATGSITPVGTATATVAATVYINEIASESFVITTGDTAATVATAITAAISAELDMPMTAADGSGVANLTAKWQGSSGNDLFVRIEESSASGLTYGVVQPSGGATNPDVDDALIQMGDTWNTVIVNCFEVGDSTTLDKYQAFGEGRWGSLTHKPLVVISGNTEADLATAYAISDARKSDYTNSQIVAPGCLNLPFVLAARAVARIALRANENPPFDYGRLKLDLLEPGTDQEQWDYPSRDAAVKVGTSTTIVEDGVIKLGDVVTFYHPDGDPLPAYRYVVDIVRLQNVIYRYAVNFNVDEWDGAPLIPDDQPTTNRAAKKPKMARALSGAIIDACALDAILADAETTKSNTVIQINSSNPKRLDHYVPITLSGNTNIKSFNLPFSFYFGTEAIIS